MEITCKFIKKIYIPDTIHLYMILIEQNQLTTLDDSLYNMACSSLVYPFGDIT